MKYHVTVEVTDTNGEPVQAVTIHGTGGIESLPGRFTDSNGQWTLDLRDIEQSSATVYLERNGYRLNPPSFEISRENCPDGYCEVTATLVQKEATAVVRALVIDQNQNGVAGVPVALAGAEDAGIKYTGKDGYAFFSILTREDGCDDRDEDRTNDSYTLMATRSVLGALYGANVGSSNSNGCTVELPSQTTQCLTRGYRFVVQAQCSANTYAYSSPGNGSYGIRVVDPNGSTIAVPLTVYPGEATVNTSSNSTFTQFTESALGVSGQYRSIAIPKGNYDFYPQEVELRPGACPKNICTVFAKPSNHHEQGVAVVEITYSEGAGATGVGARAHGSTVGTSSVKRYSDYGGALIFPTQLQNQCNDEDLSALNDRISLDLSLTGCAFAHESAFPFELCPTHPREELAVLATCNLDDVNQYTIKGTVRGPNGAAVPGARILKNGQQAFVTRDDGSYTIQVDKGETLGLVASIEQFYFDPPAYDLYVVQENLEDIDFMVYTAEGGLASGNLPAGCEAKDNYTISGIVFDHDGEPLEGVEILNNHSVVTQTGEDGRYTVDVPAESNVWLTAEFEDEYMDPYGYGIPAVACDRPETNFQLSYVPGYLLSGQVTYTDGTPISEVEILLTENGEEVNLQTDANGYYSGGVEDGAEWRIVVARESLECEPGEYAGTADSSLFYLNFECQEDLCENDAAKLTPGQCGCGNADTDTDRDGTADCNDQCPQDENKIVPLSCGCGIAETDSDGDGSLDCNDGCVSDAYKTSPGVCGCNVRDIDSDGDGTLDCQDGCPQDPNKLTRGICGCGALETDSDNDGRVDCRDECPSDPGKALPGQCGCGFADTDSDEDGTADCLDQCVEDPNKVDPGVCGCGEAETDSDGDGTPDCFDLCPVDPRKIDEGVCGCGTSDADTDGDGIPDCNDVCVNDASKWTSQGQCGCGVADVDTDQDGTLDCQESCPTDPAKLEPGVCGCGKVDQDSDEDGTYDCFDTCPADPSKSAPGVCGCFVPDEDINLDGQVDCPIECDSPVVLDFELNNLASGTQVTNQYEQQLGVVIEAESGRSNGHDVALLFNSASPTGGDNDLGTPNEQYGGPGKGNGQNAGAGNDTSLGKILIIAENTKDENNDGLIDNPDDEAKGGRITFTFPQPAAVLDVKVVDVEAGYGDEVSDEGELDEQVQSRAKKSKVTICHIPPGNPANLHTIEVGESAVGAHLAHGDYEGACQSEVAGNTEIKGSFLDEEIYSITALGLGDNTVQDVAMETRVYIDTLDVEFSGSGAIAQVTYCPSPDLCYFDPNKTEPGVCGCGVADTDSDGDGTPDCVDRCVSDPTKIEPGVCGCGNIDLDRDGDGKMACIDACDRDPNKWQSKGPCGCGVEDIDSDGDGSYDCHDECLSDPNKTSAGQCGCGELETDSDGDGTADCIDLCVSDANKTLPGQCGCGQAETDSDGDGVPDCVDLCPNDSGKLEPGQCGCGNIDLDRDKDGVMACRDACDRDPLKSESKGPCGCGVKDIDSDGDGTLDCFEACPSDPLKIQPGLCGCGVADTDSDGDGTPDCEDECSFDPEKVLFGQCGCGVEDADADNDGYAVCQDECEGDPRKTTAGQCGCGVADIDKDKDGVASCIDSCDSDKRKTEPGVCGCGVADIDKDGDGVYSCHETCDLDPLKTEPGQCGCGELDIDSDGDGVADCRDSCPLDPDKTVSNDSDNDGMVDCLDECPFDADKTERGVCGCGNPDLDWDDNGQIDCGIEVVQYCAQEGADTLRWLLKNHGKKTITFQTHHNNPLSEEPGIQSHNLGNSHSETVVVPRNIGAANPLAVVVSENTIFTRQHSMAACPPAPVEVSGKITGKNGRLLSSRESKMLQKIQDKFSLQAVVKRYEDGTRIASDVDVHTGDYSVDIQPATQASLQLFSAGQLAIRSKPKSYRPYLAVGVDRGGFHFAVRAAKLRKVYKKLRQRARSRKK